jgi:hypothetical protein
MMANELRSRQFTVNPIADPPFSLDLVLIEPSRQPISASAQAFLEVLQQESVRLNNVWNGSGKRP